MTNTETQLISLLEETTTHPIDMDEYFFTSQRNVLHELSRRRKSASLKKRMHEDAHLMKFITEFNITRPRAILFRQIGTPTHEVLRFLSLTKQLKLKPMLFEYHGDKFVSAGNSYKRSLGKMPIYQHTGTDGRDMVQYHNLFDFNTYTGKKLSSIHCYNGEELVDFHHRLLRTIGKINPKTTCVDATEWLQANGGAAHHYYESFLSLFIRDAVLFESFEPKPQVKTFFHETVLPAYQNLERRFGYNPLIVRLLPKNDETRIFWDSFPKKIENVM